MLSAQRSVFHSRGHKQGTHTGDTRRGHTQRRGKHTGQAESGCKEGAGRRAMVVDGGSVEDTTLRCIFTGPQRRGTVHVEVADGPWSGNDCPARAGCQEGAAFRLASWQSSRATLILEALRVCKWRAMWMESKKR